MDAKEYYRTGKHSQWNLSPMRQNLLKRIIGWDPRSVLEFGCGQGENLEVLMNLGIAVYGIEINESEAKAGSKRLGTIDAEILIGDESKIDYYVKDAFNVSFTCGVLDHIPEEDFYNVLSSMEKVTSGYMYCLETNHTPDKYFYPHDYSVAGFAKIDEFETIGGLYVLWGKRC